MYRDHPEFSKLVDFAGIDKELRWGSNGAWWVGGVGGWVWVWFGVGSIQDGD